MRLPYPKLLLVAVCIAGWHYRDGDFVQDLLHPSRKEAARIKFDNGTVRQTPVVTQPAGPADTPAPLGKPRKCKGAKAVSYTDGPCPAGTRELPITNGTMTVLEGSGPPRTAPAAPARTPFRSALRDVLDRSEEQSINEKHIQRSVDQ